MYLRINSVELAQQISQAMYELSVISIGGGTQYLYDSIPHPNKEEAALIIREDISLFIHPNADITKLDAFLSPLITSEELTTVHEVLEQYKGQKLNFADFIPASLANRVLTKQQLIEEGWFPNENP